MHFALLQHLHEFSAIFVKAGTHVQEVGKLLALLISELICGLVDFSLDELL